MVVWVFIGVLMAVLAVLWTAAMVLAARDKRRYAKGAAAGESAVQDFRVRAEQARNRGEMRFRTHTIHDPRGDAPWRILLWDAVPVSDDQVEGQLVPYYIASGHTRAEAEADLSAFIERWAQRVTVARGSADFAVVEEDFDNREEQA